jgi:hypothetical protein
VGGRIVKALAADYILQEIHSCRVGWDTSESLGWVDLGKLESNWHFFTIDRRIVDTMEEGYTG